MEWLATASKTVKVMDSLELLLTFAGAATIIYGGHKIWRDRRDKRRKVDDLFTPPRELPGPDSAPSQLLREEFQIVDFLGREKEIEELTAWACHKAPSGKNVSIALVAGGPGRGKSRLARHLCDLAEKWNGGTWIIGFLKENVGDENRSDFLLLMKERRPVLAIIDYAERRTEQVKKFISTVLASSRRKHPVRVLLIARAKSEGWWSGLENAFDNYSTNPFDDGRVKLMELVPIEKDPAMADRRQEFNRALRVFRTVLEKGREIKTSEDGIPDDLSGAQEVEVLDIHVAALLAAYGDDDDDAEQASAEKDLLTRLVRREQKAWDQAISKNFNGLGLKGKSIRRAIAWLATTNGLTRENDALDRLLQLPSFGESTPERQEGVARIVKAFYPGDAKAWWGGVAPNRLTTWLTRELDEMIEVDMAQEQPEVVAGLPDDALANLLRHLAWRVQRYGDEHEKALANAIRAGGRRAIIFAAKVGVETGDPIGRIVAGILSETKDAEVAHKVSGFIGDETVSLRELALVTAKILRRNATSDEERASCANNLSIRLSDLGRREEALAAIEEAVALYRDLTKAGPDAFRPHLAASLNSLSECLFGLGRREEALAVIEEAVALYRDLTKAGPDAFRPHLAASLNSLSECLFGLGRRQEAFAAIKEAVAIRRGLAEVRPGEFRSDLAASLSNLGDCLSGVGRREEALEAVKTAVAIHRELTEARPDAFRPDLAASLHSLSECLSGLGHREEALVAIKEAAVIRRELAKARPDAFHPDLAASLHSLSECLSGLGHREEALMVIEEAVVIRRELAEARPDAFRPDLAASLHSLSECLSGLGRYDEALAVIEEAVVIRRELAETQLETFCPDLAASLSTLGVFLSSLGRRQEALAATEEVVGIRRGLAKTRPDEFLPDLAKSLHNLSECLSDLGRHDEALVAIEEAVAIRHKLAETWPGAFRPALAARLNHSGGDLSNLGRRAETLAAIEEAVAIHRGLAEVRPDEFRPDLAKSLSNLSDCLSRLGRREEALAAVEEAVAIRRELAEARPGAFRPSLAISLRILSACLSELGRHKEASKAIDEANNLA